jgi:hypothetical protein
LSAALYFVVLVNEFFVLYFPLYVVAVATRAPGTAFAAFRSRIRVYVLPVAYALLTYLALYATWRLFHQSVYVGNRLDGALNPAAAVGVIAQFSLSAFPVDSLRFMFQPEERLAFANSVDLREIVSGLGAAPLLKASVAGVLFFRLASAPVPSLPRPRPLILGMLLATIAIFLPNVLLGFTAKYQGWVESGARSYLYTYHSYIAAAVLVGLVFAFVRRGTSSWSAASVMLVAIVLASLLAAITFATELRNQYVAFDQKLSHRKWQLLDRVMASAAFQAIPDGATLIAPSLVTVERGAASTTIDYWSQYARYRTGKHLTFANLECKNQDPCYLLVFRQEQHTDRQMMVLSKIEHPDLLDASSSTIYLMPSERGVSITGTFVAGNQPIDLKLNGVDVTQYSQDEFLGLFTTPMPYDPAARTQVATLTGNVGILPRQLVATTMGNGVHLDTWAQQLAQGIDFTVRGTPRSYVGASEMQRQGYPDILVAVSGVSGYEAWGRWTDTTGGRAATFRFRQPLPERFELLIKAGAFGPNVGQPVMVSVGGIQRSFVVAPEKAPQTYRLSYETDGTADTIVIVPPKPTSPKDIDPASRDPRKLGVSLYSIRVIDLASRSWPQ